MFESFLKLSKQSVNQKQEIKQTSTPPLISYSEAVAHYSEVKLQEKAWKEHVVKDIVNRLNTFIEVMGDKDIQNVSREDMRMLMTTLQKLPPNRTKTKAYAGKTIQEILATNPQKTLSVKTINITLEAISGMFEWYIHEGIIKSNPAKGLQVKDSRLSIELRNSFTKEDLEKIFHHPKFTKGTFKYPAYFWIPLIALFTGMRLEEIAQLRCKDIFKEADSGLWIIKIDEKGEDENGNSKSVKTKNAIREIPIHPVLHQLGFLDYHQHISKNANLRLFPELKQTEKTYKLGKQPGKQFNAIVQTVLDVSEKKSFHSLRHTFSDFYKQRGLQSDMFIQVYGHDLNKLSAKQYGSRFPNELLYREVIKKLDYGIDFSYLEHSQFRFNQNRKTEN